jgi:hypothetical protein
MNNQEIEAILGRIIAEGKHSDADFSQLRELLSASDRESLIQFGKNIVGKIDGQNIHIGDRIYMEWNDEVILKLLEVIQEKSDSIPLLPKELPQEEYIHLKNLLAAGRWREANDLTRIIILKAAKAEKEGWLSEEQIQNFSCQVLKVIDGLWLQYSDRRFGFSVQKRISKECEKNPQAFGDRVGWCVQNTWISASEVTYTPANAPEGHLPWGVMPVITMDNAALNSFVKAQRAVTKAVVGSDWQKLQLIADFMGFGGFLTGETVDKEEFKRNMKYELSHEEAWWEGNRLEELKVRKLFSLLEAIPNL